MSDSDKTAEQWEAFQKIWLETFSKLGETAFTFSPQSAPPDVLRNLRNGILQALGKSWDEFLRSPQFLEGMKQWMDNALQFRKMTGDFLAKARQESGAVAREDVDSMLAAIEHLERRLLDRIEDLAEQVGELSGRRDAKPAAPSSAAKGGAKARRPGRRQRS
jgi:hypothetical protein